MIHIPRPFSPGKSKPECRTISLSSATFQGFSALLVNLELKITGEGQGGTMLCIKARPSPGKVTIDLFFPL